MGPPQSIEDLKQKLAEALAGKTFMRIRNNIAFHYPERPLDFQALEQYLGDSDSIIYMAPEGYGGDVLSHLSTLAGIEPLLAINKDSGYLTAKGGIGRGHGSDRPLLRIGQRADSNDRTEIHSRPVIRGRNYSRCPRDRRGLAAVLRSSAGRFRRTASLLSNLRSHHRVQQEVILVSCEPLGYFVYAIVLQVSGFAGWTVLFRFPCAEWRMGGPRYP
jgi:hypothetical protein